MVTTEVGVTTSVVFPLTAKSATVDAGWLTVGAPFEVRIVEGGEVLGTSASSKIMIPAGNHEIDLVNQSLGYEDHRKIDVQSGKTAQIRVDARAPLNANAKPWADVTIDGVAVGQTPIANYVLALGTHQIVFRHPDLGEPRQDVVITAKGPNRISVDLTK